MKIYKIYAFILVALALGLIACDNFDEGRREFDNAVYLDVAKMSNIQTMTFKKTLIEMDKQIVATLAYPNDTDIAVSIAVVPKLVENYNTAHNTDYPMLDAKYYSLSDSQVAIHAGKTTSEAVTVHFTNLDELEIDKTYLCPVTIADASITVLNGAATTYYLVKRSSAITSAASLRNNWITFPELDKWGPLAERYSNLTAITFEAIIRVDDFSKHSEISTVMGIEDYLLLRIGDASFPREQLQFDGSGAGFGKFPKRDESKNLRAGEWYHVACSYDQTTRIVRIFVNGKIQSEGTEMGSSTPEPINLAKRAYYNLYESNLDNPEYEKYMGWSDARQLFVGKSYDDTRQLNGDVAEVRVWSVARTEQEIWDNMYDIADPGSEPNLLGYWKFDEGAGNTIKDRTGHGNDAVAAYDLVWPEGIEIPQINREE